MAIYMAKMSVILKTVLKTIGRFFRDADIFLLGVSLVSAIYGIVLISSVTANYATSGHVATQIRALTLGLGFYILFSYIDIDIIAERKWLLFVFSLFFILLLRFWGEGEEEWGNRAWLRFAGFGVQPAEVVKITFAIIISKMLVEFKEQKTLNSVVSILQILLVSGSIFGMIIFVSSDLGSALIFIFMLAVMMFVAGVRLRWFALGGIVVAALSPLIFELLSERQQLRILAPFFPNEYDPDRQGVLWQANQSVRAITGGGFRGQGLGQGEVTQANIIPEQHNDFIFSVAGEELGFVGALAVITLLIIIIIRCFYVGMKSNNPLGLLVCVGLAAKFMAQMLENIGMCLGLLPVVGINLPFFSYGGSSIVTSMAAIGIVSGVKMRPKPTGLKNY